MRQRSQTKEALFDEIRRRLRSGQETVGISLDEIIDGRTGEYEHTFFASVERGKAREYLLGTYGDSSKSEMLGYHGYLGDELLDIGLQATPLRGREFRVRAFQLPEGPNHGRYPLEVALKFLDLTEEEFDERFSDHYEESRGLLDRTLQQRELTEEQFAVKFPQDYQNTLTLCGVSSRVIQQLHTYSLNKPLSDLSKRYKMWVKETAQSR